MGFVLSYSDFVTKGEKNLFLSLHEKRDSGKAVISLHNITGRAMWLLHLLGYK